MTRRDWARMSWYARQHWGVENRQHYVRDVTFRAPAGGLIVDGRQNGGVAFFAWEGNNVLVKALIQTNADSRADARDIAGYLYTLK